MRIKSMIIDKGQRKNDIKNNRINNKTVSTITIIGFVGGFVMVSAWFILQNTHHSSSSQHSAVVNIPLSKPVAPQQALKPPSTNQSSSQVIDSWQTNKDKQMVGANFDESEKIVAMHFIDEPVWQQSNKAKSQQASFLRALEVDEKYYMDIDLKQMQALRTGDAIKLVSHDQQQTQVVLAYDRSSADVTLLGEAKEQKEWGLTDLSGNSVGRLSISEHAIEGHYQGLNGQEYIVEGNGDVGRVVPKKELIALINNNRPEDQSIASLGIPEHPDYGWPETSFNPDRPNDKNDNPEFTYRDASLGGQ